MEITSLCDALFWPQDASTENIEFFLVQVIWSLKTPFREFSQGVWELNYSARQNQLRADTKVDFNGQVMAVNVNGKADLDQHMLEGALTINTPFSGTFVLSSK